MLDYAYLHSANSVWLTRTSVIFERRRMPKDVIIELLSITCEKVKKSLGCFIVIIYKSKKHHVSLPPLPPSTYHGH